MRARRTRFASFLRVVRLILTGAALLVGAGLLPLLVNSFFAALIDPWPMPLAITGIVVGIAIFLGVFGFMIKNFNKIAAATRWLVLAGWGLVIALSPLLLLAARGSWEAQYRS